MRTSVRIFTGALAAAALCSGCGEDDGESDAGDEEKAVRATIERLEQATRERDAGRICDEIYAEDAVRSLERRPGGCEGRVKKAFVADTEGVTVHASRVTVNGDRASALVRSKAPSGKRVTATYKLVKADGQWRILVAE